MEEDAFDDNGWSRFFAPDAQRKADPPKTQCDLIQENLTSATECERSIVEEELGAECMLRTEDNGNKIDLSIRKPEEQRKVEDSKKYDASVDMKICEKDDEIPEDQTSLHIARVTSCEIRYCKIAPLLVDEAKHTISPTEWSPFDTASLKVKDEDKRCNKEAGKEYRDQLKSVAKSPPVDSLSFKNDRPKAKINHKESKYPVGNLAKVATESPHQEIENDKDIKRTKKAKHVGGDQKKEAAESSRFESSSLEEKNKDENYTREEAKADGEQTKATSVSPSFESSSLEGNKDKNSADKEGKIIGDPAKELFKWTTFDPFSLKENKDTNNPDEEGKVVSDQAKPVTKWPSFNSSSLKENKDKSCPDEEGKESCDQEKALFKWFTSDSLSLKENKDENIQDEDGKVAGDQPKVVTESSLFDSLPLKEDTDKNYIIEAKRRVDNRPIAETELHHVNTGCLSSKSAEKKKDEKPQTAVVNASKPEISSKSFKSFNFACSVFFAISLSVLFTGAPGTLVVAPEDVIGMKGENIRLRCSTQFQKAVYWERILVGSKEQQTIYFGISGMVNIDGANGRFKIDSDPETGRYDLVIKDLQPMDAATYICVDDNGIGEEKRAQLIVIDHFSCEMPMPRNGFMGENTVKLPVDYIQASCNLQYRGHETPRIQWRLNDNQISATHAINGSTVTSVVTLRGTKELNGAQLSSLPTISAAHLSERDADTWWTSAHLKVNYIHVELGEVVECQHGSAMVPVCFPSCEYQLTEMPANDLCYCVAVYNMNGVSYDITFNKHPCNGVDSASNNSSIIIAFCAIVFGLLIAIIVALICMIKQIKRRSRERTERLQSVPINA